MLGYWGELAERGGLDVVRELGLAGAGGDLFCDGAFGSHTAALSEPYTDRPETAGALRFETASLVDHVAGLHDAPASRRASTASATPPCGQVLDAVGAVVDELGAAAVRACRHRLEHVEMADDGGHRADARPGGWSPASSPPSTPPGAATPACTSSGWGPSGRAGCNPFADLADAGVALALGSDAPVTPLDPWGGVHAAVDHRTPASGLRPFDAFDAATHGGWYAARAEHAAGPLAVGAPGRPRPLGHRPDPVRRPDQRARPHLPAAPRRRRTDRRSPMSTLHLDPTLVARARELAARAARR